MLAKGCSWLYAVAASSGLIIYFQVIPGGAFVVFHDICCFFVLIQVVLSIFPVQLTPKKTGEPYTVDIQFSERFENQPLQCYVCIVARFAQL